MKRVIIRLNRLLGRLTNWSFIALPFGVGLSSGGRERASFGKIAESLFRNRTLKWSDEGYWSVFPKIRNQELVEYYENAYWANRGGKNNGLRVRDIQHFLMLKEIAPELFSLANPKALNFGSGHGGLSYLLHAQGINVINIEPSEKTPRNDVDGWKTVRSIEDVQGEKFNLIYGSHSLEHVADLEVFEEQISALHGNPFCLGFWEVPNAGRFVSGSHFGKIDIPHTYYFTHAYFQRHFRILLHLENYPSDGMHPSTWEREATDSGIVIRALGLYHGSLRPSS